MDVYAENILDHYRHPQGKGALSNADITHKEINVSCGDELTLTIKMDGEKIADIAWEGTGCAISQASMSLLLEELKGMDLSAIEKMNPEHVYELLGVPIGTRRVKCALLPLHTLKNAIHVYKKEAVQGWNETIA